MAFLKKMPFFHFLAQQHCNEAREAGATEVGGSELIRAALKGNVKLGDYEYIVAHADIMTELLQLRGLLKRKFPSLKEQTVGTDPKALIRSFIDGILIEGKKDDFQKTFGLVKTIIGTVRKSKYQMSEGNKPSKNSSAF